MSVDPLLSRALPGSLWEKVPVALYAWDIWLQDWISQFISPVSPFWYSFKTFTERPKYIFVQCIFFFVVVLGLLKMKHTGLKVTHYSLSAIFLLAWVGLSDLISASLKVPIGRLKPHVNFYHPNFIPALSFPSNHAANTFTLLTLVYLLLKRFKIESSPTVFLFSIFTVVIGLSRILLDEHHPLDILAGWTFGAVFGTLGFQLFLFLSRGLRKK